ncbi:MAG: methyltransferase domain-containing protein [Paracoccaceae bacterium]
MNAKKYSDRGKMKKSSGYNERVFGGGLRAFIHNGRFNWVRRVCKRRGQDLSSVFELGCFDGRLLDWLPAEPGYYLGIDADWEGGLSAAQERFDADQRRDFMKTADASALASVPDNSFTAAFALETLEHIPDDELDRYITEIARILNGTLYVTVPNEKGVIFFLKYLVKSVLYEGNQDYSLSEFMNATLGRLHRIERNEHKGFDYAALIRTLARDFSIDSIHSLPLPGVPPFTAVTIGIVARSR